MENNLERQFNSHEKREEEFVKENWVLLLGDELESECEPVRNGKEHLEKEDRELLEEARDYYQRSGDLFNLIRLELKFNNVNKAERLVEKYLRLDEEPDFPSPYFNQDKETDETKVMDLKKAYVLKDLARAKKDKDLREQAAEKFIQYAEEQAKRKELSGDEASALAFQQASKLVPFPEKELIEQRSITQFQKVVLDRARAGDRWWENIAFQQIGRLSSDLEDKQKAIQRLEELAEEYIQMSDYENAALLAQDINDLDPSNEHAKSMEKLWAENIKKAQKNGKIREVAKSYWQLWKHAGKDNREKKEAYRKQAIEWYKKLKNQAEESGNEEKTRECYLAFSELIG